MPSKTPDTVTQQIAVILGTSGSGQPLLNILRRLLGKDTGTELHGVYIENDELQRAAALPFVKELCRLTLSVREIHNTQFDRTTALRMRTARSAVEELARHMGVPHTFREAQGSTIRLLRETVHSSDVTVFEPLSRLAGPTIRQSMHGERVPRRIVVVIDEVETGDEALLIATLLAESDTRRISILLRAETPAELEVMDNMISDLLPAGTKRLLLLPDHGVQHLIAAVLAERADMLVLGASEELLKTESLGSLLKQLNCPICLVRHFDRGSTKPLPDSLIRD